MMNLRFTHNSMCLSLRCCYYSNYLTLAFSSWSSSKGSTTFNKSLIGVSLPAVRTISLSFRSCLAPFSRDGLYSPVSCI
uniref:Uncharacterized protein n=1 Tax=uncultured marine virus TaxID=186617 RepID=A0A0F7LA10_9VIRU|nr:hypothetical protein [uncultured marine virus]